jgi:hypothetical protein
MCLCTYIDIAIVYMYLLKNTNNLPLSSVTLQQLMRLLNPLKRENLLNKHPKRPINELGQSMLNKRIPQLPLILHIPTAQRAPLNPHPLIQQRRDIHPIRQLAPAHQAEEHDASVARCHVQVSLEIGGTDEIDCEIDAGAGGRGLDLGGPVLGSVVEDFCDAKFLFQEIDFLLRARCGVDGFCAGGFGELDS